MLKGKPAATPHPRHHALTMAAAKHLESCGHLTPEQCARINNDARSKLALHKAQKDKPAAKAPPFGRLAP